MNYIDFIKKIDQRKLNKPIFFHVKEIYLYDMAIQSIKADYIGYDLLDLNFQLLDFEKLDLKELDTALETLPVFSEKRVVLLKNMGLQKDNLKRNAQNLDFIEDKIKSISPTTLFIMSYEGDNLYKGKFVKNIDKLVDFFDIARLNQRELYAFIQKYFINHKINLDMRPIKLISDRLGYLEKASNMNLYEVENELDKLANNIKLGQIRKQDIEDLIDQYFEDDIFAFINVISKKDVSSALAMFSRMDKDQYFMVFHMILRHVRNLICVKDCENKMFSKQSSLKFCALSPFEHDKDKILLKNFSMKDLISLHSFLYEIEIKIKTSSQDMDYLMERLIYEFCKR